MKIATIIVRILLGLMFVVFGLNGFLQFIPMKEMPQGLAGDFFKVMSVSHYMQAISAFQILGGLLLLIGLVPLGLLVLGPILVNILLFHIFLQPSGMAPGIVASLLALFLLWSYRWAFAGMVRTSPPARNTATPV